ncbi:hypothetical protein OB03_03715 [Brevundimonas sp. GN22]
MISGFSAAHWITVLLAVAVGLILVLVLFSGKLPPKVRRGIEAALSVGYPVLVAVFFALQSWTEYQAANQVSAIGYTVGGVVMVALATRGYLKGRKRS